VRSYIACLSKEDDDLSQWRAYGSGRGFPIGFDGKAPTDDEFKAFAGTFAVHALRHVPSFKHPAFASEREMRLHVFQSSSTDAINMLISGQAPWESYRTLR
jgi:hypothetical protein